MRCSELLAPRLLFLSLRPIMLALILPMLLAVPLVHGARAADSAPVPPGSMGEREITIVNRSKQAINELYISPAHSDDWGDDRLGDDTLDVGDNIHVRLGRMRDCAFDIHVVYDDGSREESLNNNVCRTRQVALDGSHAVAPPPAEEHAVVIVNNAALPIQMVFISPAESNDWGDDRLADDSISVGASKSVTYRGDCAADLRIVFDNRSAEERRGLNLCDTPRISIQAGWTTADTVPTGQPAGKAPGAPEPATQPATLPATLDITLINHSGRDAAEFYLFPQDAKDRGPDRLGTNVLKNNDKLSLHIPKGAGCRYNAHIVYAGKTSDADLTGLDLCASPQVTLAP
jgi:hypothetical protein